jgi:hypothetical protein
LRSQASARIDRFNNVQRRSIQESWKVREELSPRTGQRLRQLRGVLKGHIPLAPLYPADVIAMQIRPFAKLSCSGPTAIVQ